MYTELYFVFEFVVTLVIIVLSGAVLGERPKIWRYLLSAFFSAAAGSAAVFMPGYEWAGACASLLFCVCLAWRFRYFLCIARRLGALVGVSLVAGGAAFLADNALAGALSATALTAIGLGITLASFTAVYSRRVARGAGRFIVSVRILKRSQSIDLRGMIDTGNLLTSPISGEAVIVVSQYAYNVLIANKDIIRCAAASPFGIRHSCVAHVDSVLIWREHKWREYGACCVMAGNVPLSRGVEALLPALFIE